jgi:hypothetical protein
MTSSVQLERDVEQTRGELAHTLEELRDRLTPGQLVDESLDYARDTIGGEFVRNLSRQAAANPLSVCVVGAGLAWMMLSNSQTATRLSARGGERLAGTAREAAEGIGNMARDASERVADWATSARDKASDAVSSTARRIKGTTEATRSSVGDASRNNEQASSLSDNATVAYETTKSQVASVVTVARDNWLPLSLIGAALAWMFFSNSRTASHLGARAGERLSRGTEKVRDAFQDAGQRVSDIAQDATDRLSRGTEKVRDTFGEAGQRVTEMAQDASDGVSERLADARNKVSDAFRSSNQPGTKTAPSVGESASSPSDSAKAQTGDTEIQNTERAYQRAGGEAQRQGLTGFPENKHTPSREECHPLGEPSAASSSEHRFVEEQAKP